MLVNILQLQTDSGGNQGWVLIDQQMLSSGAILAYITNLALDGNSYAAEVSTDIGMQRLAQVP